MSKFKPKQATDVFNQEVDTSLEAVDAKLYGNVDLVPNSGRVVIRPVDIMTIWPDLAQPRRAIPISMRGKWDGNPKQVMDVLTKWWQATEWSLDMKIDVPGILKGRDQGENGLIIPDDKATAEAFVELLRLGASIFAEGLTNAITIAPRGERFLIETGERRWLAHHLLHHFVDEKFGKILAREVTYDRFRQASENNNRRKLTAIEMARQLALLLMDMYEGDKDVHFDTIEALTFEGCDRRYYAQVAHGRVWQIKKGYAERMQAAMGLPSLDRVADYRKVLRPTEDEELNDKIWMQADDENWTQNRIYEYVEGLKNPPNVGGDSNVPSGSGVGGDSNTPDTPIADSDSHPPTASADQSDWPSHDWAGKLAYSGSVKVFVNTASEPDKVIVTPEGSTEEIEVKVSSLSEYIEPAAPTGTSKTPPSQAAKDWTSRAVQTVTGAVALVQKDAFGILHLKFPDGSTATIKKEFASLVDMTEWWAAVKRHKAAQAGGNNAVNNTGASTSVTTTKHSTQAIEPDGDESEEDDEVSEIADFEPFSAAFREAMQRLAESAVLLGISEAVLIDDLCRLELQEVERIVHAEGIEATERILAAYRIGINDAMEKIARRIATYIDDIVVVARNIAEGK